MTTSALSHLSRGSRKLANFLINKIGVWLHFFRGSEHPLFGHRGGCRRRMWHPLGLGIEDVGLGVTPAGGISHLEGIVWETSQMMLLGLEPRCGRGELCQGVRILWSHKQELLSFRVKNVWIRNQTLCGQELLDWRVCGYELEIFGTTGREILWLVGWGLLHKLRLCFQYQLFMKLGKNITYSPDY